MLAGSASSQRIAAQKATGTAGRFGELARGSNTGVDLADRPVRLERPLEGRQAWWRCPEGHEFPGRPDKVRVTDQPCPTCRANVRPHVGDSARLTAMWHPERNEHGPQRAAMTTRAWWRCQKGHEWFGLPATIAIANNPCPSCRKLDGPPPRIKRATGSSHPKSPRNSILSDPRLKLLHRPEPGLDPGMVAANSTTLMWWRCPDCGHEWRHTPIQVRRLVKACPQCRSVTPKIAADPRLSRLWHPDRNPGRDPKRLSANSSKPVSYWWQCPDCGNEWQSSTQEVYRDDRPCPACRQKAKPTLGGG